MKQKPGFCVAHHAFIRLSGFALTVRRRRAGGARSCASGNAWLLPAAGLCRGEESGSRERASEPAFLLPARARPTRRRGSWASVLTRFSGGPRAVESRVCAALVSLGGLLAPREHGARSPAPSEPLSSAEHLFLQTFWQTVTREWAGIDRRRLDKLCVLTRLVLRQSFEVLKRSGWEESQIQLFLDVLMKEVLHPESQAPNGVKLHFVDIYLEELSRVGGKELLADQNLKFIDPFCKVAARAKDRALVQTIARGVFEVIVDQSPLVPEGTLGVQKAGEGDSDLSEEETSESDVAWRRAAGKKPPAPGGPQSRKEGVGDGGRDDAGSSEDAGPLLQFDYRAVAERLREVATSKDVPPFNRKRLSRLIRKFRDLSEGTKSFPAEEEEAEGGLRKRKRKRKKRNHLRPAHLGPGSEAVCPEQNGSREPEAGPGKAQQTSAAELGAGAAPSLSRRKRLRKRSLRAQVQSPEAAASPPEDVAPGGPGSGPTQGVALAGGAPVLKKQRKLGALLVNGSGPPTRAWPPQEGPPARPADGGGCPAAVPQIGELGRKKGEPGGLDLRPPCARKAAVLKKRKKVSQMSPLAAHRGLKLVQALGGAGILRPLRKELRTEKDFVKFEAAFSPKPLFFRKAKSSTTAPPGTPPQPNRTPSGTKKVTFGLSRNMTAEFRKTDKSLLVSPTGPSRVAFNPAQRPLHGVLKTPTSSPAGAPLGTRQPLTATPKRRPTAMDFF
ncbi:ribosomal RNA processing protein 1 homolog B isoform X4 [Phacochoerus africanus]|uniref:ribosomal RNA processing protein 1 homolog B isoform X4 n=1 Tax=Phacochoerus africanus TaxID=41426 RepID=UPI001FD96814|nr:ribosomal RNA processing protein 1 homolog B isoform X4 [Phacochoerus africanus]